MAIKTKILLWNGVSFFVFILFALFLGIILFYALSLKYFENINNFFYVLKDFSNPFDIFENKTIAVFVFHFMFYWIVGMSSILLISYIIIRKKINHYIEKPLQNSIHLASEVQGGNYDISYIESGIIEVDTINKSIIEVAHSLMEKNQKILISEENRIKMISSIAHDIKTPITTIKGYANGIIDGIANSDAKRDEYLSKIISKSDYMNSLIEQLLTSNKLEINKLTYELVEINIYQLIQEIIEEISIDLKNNNAEITIGKPPKNIMILGDNLKLRRVFINILYNALSYKKGNICHVNISFENIYDNLIICFEDQGIGISEADLPHVFESFYRSDSARASENSGLGLYICKLIIEMHKGKIWIKSTLNIGSSVFISFKNVRD